MALQAYPDVLSLIGNTPLVATSGLDTGACKLFLKLESQNPSGSIKDRVGLYMIEAAEREVRTGLVWSMAIAGGMPLIESSWGLSMRSRNWRA